MHLSHELAIGVTAGHLQPILLGQKFVADLHGEACENDQRSGRFTASIGVDITQECQNRFFILLLLWLLL